MPGVRCPYCGGILAGASELARHIKIWHDGD